MWPAIKPAKNIHYRCWRITMKWTDPDFKDLRLGFEVTAYVYVR
ncbi:pyrroloquinoline quinone precursor peptide PqqA [Marinobacter sp. SS13-12]